MSRKESFLLSFGVFLTVIAWLIADLYHAAYQERIKTKVKLPAIQKYQIDANVLEVLEKKQE